MFTKCCTVSLSQGVEEDQEDLLISEMYFRLLLTEVFC